MILIAEDDEAIAELLRYNLQRDGHTVLVAFDGKNALDLAFAHAPDLISLDEMMPVMSGRQVLKELKRDARTQDTPVIFLTARAQTEDKIRGLELGADDYITKPFSPKELLLRINNILKRAETTTSSLVSEVGPYRFDKNALKFYVDGSPVDLTSTEFKLMVYFAEHAEHALTRTDLMRSVWGYSDNSNSRTLDTHLKRLRQKIAPYSDHIETIRGVGYRFKF